MRPRAAGVRELPEVDVRLVDVVKKFGDQFAVDHIDLEVRDGEFFSLLGPSGCGKTTTLRMIGGFEQPTSGPDRAPGPGRHVAAAVQAQRQHGLPELRPLPAPDDLRERRVRPAPQGRQGLARSRAASPRCSASSSCPATRRRKPTQISGGQAQRVALARALINRPAVLLLDEPLGALDLKLRKQMQVELKRIQQEVGITFIYVTHDQEEAMTMSDRIAVMNKGRYEQLGDPESLYERPDDPVRRRLPRRQQPPAGDGRGRRRRRTPRSDARATTPRSACPGPSSTADAGRQVGVRPEKIRLTRADRRRTPPATTG